MGLLTNLLLFPIAAPVNGIRWTLGKVQHVAEEQLTDDTAVKQELMEPQMQLELGDIEDAEYLRRETKPLPRACENPLVRAQLRAGHRGGAGRLPPRDR